MNRVARRFDFFDALNPILEKVFESFGQLSTFCHHFERKWNGLVLLDDAFL